MNTLTKYWFLEGFNLFQKLGRINMMRICEILEMAHFAKGDLITQKSDNENSIFFLKKGTVKIVDSITNTVKYIVKKGHIFGELILYDKTSAFQEQAYALEDCIVCYIEVQQMQDIMEKHKSLKNGVIKIYGLRIKKLERRLQNLIYKDSITRIKEFIVDYINDHGDTHKDKIVAKHLLTHKDIANLTSTSRQTVSNTLSKMRKNKDIEYNAKYLSILILKKDKLQEAFSDTDTL